MSVAELIAQLQQMPQDMPVRVWSPYGEDWMDVETVEQTEGSHHFPAEVRIAS